MLPYVIMLMSMNNLNKSLQYTITEKSTKYPQLISTKYEICSMNQSKHVNLGYISSTNLLVLLSDLYHFFIRLKSLLLYFFYNIIPFMNNYFLFL